MTMLAMSLLIFIAPRKCILSIRFFLDMNTSAFATMLSIMSSSSCPSKYGTA
jgi:hypothetical protein